MRSRRQCRYLSGNVVYVNSFRSGGFCIGSCAPWLTLPRFAIFRIQKNPREHCPPSSPVGNSVGRRGCTSPPDHQPARGSLRRLIGVVRRIGRASAPVHESAWSERTMADATKSRPDGGNDPGTLGALHRAGARPDPGAGPAPRRLSPGRGLRFEERPFVVLAEPVGHLMCVLVPSALHRPRVRACA